MTHSPTWRSKEAPNHPSKTLLVLAKAYLSLCPQVCHLPPLLLTSTVLLVEVSIHQAQRDGLTAMDTVVAMGQHQVDTARTQQKATHAHTFRDYDITKLISESGTSSS